MGSLSGLHFLKQYPPEQLWRLFVDGRFWAKEKGWRGYESREAGSLSAGLESFFYFVLKADSTKDFSVNVDLIKEIHSKCGKGVTKLKDKSPGKLRTNEPVSFAIPANRASIDGICELFNIPFIRKSAIFGPGTSGIFAPKINKNQFTQVSNNLEEVENLADSIYYQMLKDGYSRNTHFYIAPRKQIKATLENITFSYNQDIKKANSIDEKIEIIAKYTKYYELLHPFKDANGRTFVNILMNIMLMKEGLPPATFYEPNVFDLYSSKELARVIKESMFNTLQIIKASKEKKATTLYGYKEKTKDNFLNVFNSPSYKKFLAQTVNKSDDQQNQSKFASFFSTLANHYPLHWHAVYSSDDEKVDTIINQHKPHLDKVINQGAPPFYVGRTALHVATIANNKRMFDKLIANSADIKIRDHYGKTPLHYIAEYNYLDILAQHASLLKDATFLSIQDGVGKTALHYAAASGNIDLVKQLLNNNPNYINLKDIDKKTAIHYAVQSGSDEVVRLLIKHGANIDAIDALGDTPISIACHNKEAKVITTLLDYGTTISEKTLALVANAKNIVSFNAILDKNSSLLVDKTVFSYAINSGDIKLVKRFIDAGIDINIPLDKNGTTALMKAVMNNNQKLFLFLINKNADATHKNSDGDNLFHVIAYSAIPSIIKTALDIKGMDQYLYTQNKKGVAPLGKFATKPMQSFLLFIKHGLSIKEPIDKNGNNVLHYAMEALKISNVKEFLKIAPSLIYAKNKQGETPLISALKKTTHLSLSDNQSKIISLCRTLSKRNYDFSITDNTGNSAIDYAFASGCYHLALALTKLDQAPTVASTTMYLINLDASNIPSTKELTKMLLKTLSKDPLIAASQLNSLYRKIKKNKIIVPKNYKDKGMFSLFSKKTSGQQVHTKIMQLIEQEYVKKIKQIPKFLAADKTHSLNSKNDLIKYLPKFLKCQTLSKKLPYHNINAIQETCLEALSPKNINAPPNVT